MSHKSTNNHPKLLYANKQSSAQPSRVCRPLTRTPSIIQRKHPSGSLQQTAALKFPKPQNISHTYNIKDHYSIEISSNPPARNTHQNLIFPKKNPSYSQKIYKCSEFGRISPEMSLFSSTPLPGGVGKKGGGDKVDDNRSSGGTGQGPSGSRSRGRWS